MQLEWQSLLPDSALVTALHTKTSKLAPLSIHHMQPRLQDAISLFCQNQGSSRFMLLHADEGQEHMAWIAQLVQDKVRTDSQIHGVAYQIEGNHVHCLPASSREDNFAAQSGCLFADWVESDELFGCLRTSQQQHQLCPGLVHQANGGVLLLSLHTLLTQPRLWFRLKQMVTAERFRWLPGDESKPLPLSIPDMPLDLRVILVGTAFDLAELQATEPALSERACYGELESQLLLKDEESLLQWCRYVHHLAGQAKLPPLHEDIWPVLIRAAVRDTGAHHLLPLCPLWLSDQLRKASQYVTNNKLDGQALQQALDKEEWRLGYLQEKLQQEILTGQLSIDTEGQVIGQINGLSVLEFPGFPHAIGEPSRISCVAHIGDGEITDVDRKVDLAGSLHAKGMMIMQAFLISELDLDHPFPFAASVVFEQSY
ncbi:MAG: AAA family ATPase, partial [Enterobacteriaceae bacterium]